MNPYSARRIFKSGDRLEIQPSGSEVEGLGFGVMSVTGPCQTGARNTQSSASDMRMPEDQGGTPPTLPMTLLEALHPMIKGFHHVLPDHSCCIPGLIGPVRTPRAEISSKRHLQLNPGNFTP